MYDSQIRCDIQDIAKEHYLGANIYRQSLIPDVLNYFSNKPFIESDWHDYVFEDCGVFYIAWIENGMLFTEAFAWRL